MKKMLGLLALGVFSAVGCNGKSDDTGSLTGDATAGATVYSASCAACHNDDGSGQEGYSPSLFDEVPEKSDDELTSIILDGYDAMPAQDLTDQETADVIAYCRQEFGEYEGG